MPVLKENPVARWVPVIIWVGLFLYILIVSGLASAMPDQENAAPQPARDVLADPSPAPEAQEFQSIDTLFSLYQPYVKNLSFYKPIYFLAGIDPSESRFQFSFKYQFLNPGLSFIEKYHWVKGFHLAYTQTSFWDLKARSQPFKDTSYKPEVFFLTPNLVKKGFGGGQLFIQTGYQHESNGRDEDFSRSTNYLYLRPVLIVYDAGSEFGVQVAPKIWAYVSNDEDTNPDLNDYRGYFDLEIKAGTAGGAVLETHFQAARKGSSLYLDLTWPLSNLFENIDIYLQAQYVNALAESLINYQQRTRAVRLGFAFVR